ncbi:type VI secretion protein IcmF/TssM N-terminal domain-containing protein [Achromobacter anxifer]
MLTSNLFLLSVVVLTLVVLAVLGIVLYFARNGAHKKPEQDRKVLRLRSDSLRNAFRQAVELIEANIAARGERYRIPWIMVLNEGDGSGGLPIAQAGVPSVLGSEAAGPTSTQGISWNFFDRGIVIDIKAAYLDAPGQDSNEKPWDEFLGLCRGYRPQRPFDSVVITVPASMLLATDTDSQLELARRAKLAHRRLWLAQNRFAMRFAVYVVVTDCEALEGFSEFAAALPEPLRASMLGWSSPYDLSTTYQSDWVEAAMRSITGAVSDASAELFAVDAGTADARGFLLLPARIQALQAQLQLYVDELLRPSAYHEPFFFRGIYLTGDSGELAARTMGRQAEPGPQAEAEDAEPYVGGGREGVGPALADLLRQPAFLRDLFERKIFQEYGLTRPSRSQHLTRPVLHRALRWGGIALLGVWGGGLVIATVELGRHNGPLVAALEETRRDARERAVALQQGQELPAEWYRRRALALLTLDQGLQVDSAWTVFMPGSWSRIDDLNPRVRARFAREFGEIAVTAIQRELAARASQLTGVGLDPVSGTLLPDGLCAAPAVLDGDEGKVASLGIDEQPELRALQRYVAGADQFDAALRAFQRLRQPGGGNADALRLVVRYALGADLQGDLGNVLPYFSRGRERNVSYSMTPAGEEGVAGLQQAFGCAFEKASAQLNRRLFSNNPLLLAERAVAQSTRQITDATMNAEDAAQVGDSYRRLVAAITAQQDLLAAGKGGWMRQASFTPGTAYDRVMSRAAQNRLLGAEAAAQARERDRADFEGFKSERALRFDGPDSGLLWQEKEARYALSPARLALRDAFAGLLAQPFMALPRDLQPPVLDGAAVIVWNRVQLDQALTLGEVRKRFLADGLKSVPPVLLPVVERALDVQFGRLVFDQTMAAATPAQADAGEDSTAFTAARNRLLRIRALLAELGASRQADTLDTLVSRDAMEHLRQVDRRLQRSELYATRLDAEIAVPAARTSVLAMFGVADAAGLGPYLDHQSGRALTLGAEAGVYLAALDPISAASPLAQRWRAINQDLERYRLRNPNSSLLRLEQFVQAVADPATGGCKARPAGAAPPGGDDYFGAVYARLYSALQGRCNQRYVSDLRQQWEDFAATFNVLVAGRAPFSGGAAGPVARYASVGSVGGQSPSGLASADYGQLGQTLKRYDGVAGTYRDADGEARGATPSGSVTRFIDNFAQVRSLFAPLYPSEEGGPAGYDLNVEFRANRGGELAANQLIDWTLAMGGQSLSLGDAPRTLHWNYGTPVTLTLRFAKDSPLIAMADPRQPALTTDGRILTWQFSDPWALISLMQRHQAADSGPRGAGPLLRFDFPLGMANAARMAQVPDLEEGRVFLRMALMPAGKKTPLQWPNSFPARAPEWSAQ